MAEDYYALLKVPRNAPAEDIEDVLRVELMKWSRRANNAPKAVDRHEAEQRVELLGAAKATLTDPGRRAQYDQSIGLNSPGPAMPPPIVPIQPTWPSERTSNPPADSPWQPPQPATEPWWTPWFVRLARQKGWLPPAGRPRTTGRWMQRIRHPIWTACLVVFALAAFGSAGTAKNSGGEVALGLFCLAVALRVSGFWRRR
jgi:hypothetical protein